VEVAANSSMTSTSSVRNCLFENCDTAVDRAATGYTTIGLTNVKKHSVNTPTSGGGIYGSMTDELFYTDTNFRGLNSSEANVVPDTMGAVGKSHFVELLNGGGDLQSIAAYSKIGGSSLEQRTPAAFFAVTYQGTSYPLGDLADGKILYDQQSQRWVACAIDKGSQNVILAVSSSDSPVPLASNWNKYLVAIGIAPWSTDSATLGVDVNGIYLSVLYFNTPGFVNDGNEVVAIKKPDIYLASYVPTDYYVPPSDLKTTSIQPVVNFDASPLGGYAWFVAKGPSTGQGTSYKGAPLQYRRLSWNGSTAQWADSSWLTLPEPQPTYLDYFDLDGPNINAPQLGASGITLQRTGSRLRTPVVTNQVLWVCQHLGVAGTGGTYAGDESGSTVDRSAVQWLELQLNLTVPALTHIAHGRIYDAAASYPYYYYMPSLMVNVNGDMVIGFSGSKATEYVGAFYAGRLANGTTSGSPTLLQAGRAAFAGNPVYWGDYSYTCLDPVDGSLWTVQQYAEIGGVAWGTWITKVKH
jgi:hypothetical protein